ncbi:hypothetical protein IH981_02940 [Patescibacteria group bacterium]|nr:hypothetical protein [Patescibacteria group bacterium]
MFGKKLFKKRVLSKKLQTTLIILLIGSWTLASWPQIPFINFPPKVQEAQAAVTYTPDCDGTIQTAASAVAISACDVGTGLTDAILIISVFGDDGGGTHGAPTVTRGTGSTCGTATETATIIDTEVSNGDASVSTYRLLDADFAEGSADVCVSWASSDPPDEWSAHITVFTGVDQSTFTSATASQTFGNVNVVTHTITIAADEHGYQANSCNSNASVTTLHADDVERFVLITGGSDKSTSHVSTQTVTGSPATMGVTLYSKTCVTAVMKLITLNDAPAAVTLTQNDFELFVDNDALTPTDEWPTGALALGENVALTAVPPAFDPIDPTDEIRIRMNISVTGAQLDAATEGFILQYKETNDCTDAGAWTDVDVAAGGGTWRFAASSVTDDTALDGAALLISTSEEEGRYNKVDPTGTNPVAVPAGQELEWDWHVEYNGAAEAHTYCFRMRKDDPADLDAYNSDSYPKVDTRPSTDDQMRHGNFFSTGEERGYFWAD